MFRSAQLVDDIVQLVSKVELGWRDEGVPADPNATFAWSIGRRRELLLPNSDPWTAPYPITGGLDYGLLLRLGRHSGSHAGVAACTKDAGKSANRQGSQADVCTYIPW